MYGSHCLDTVMNLQTIPTMTYEIGGLAASTVLNLDGFTDTITIAGTEDCGPRQYVITGDAITNGILVYSYVDATTSALTLTTTDPTYLGTSTVTIVANLVNHTFLNDMTKIDIDGTSDPWLTVTMQFDVTVTGLCQTTSFIENSGLTDSRLHIVDTNPTEFTFISETQDSVGTAVN